MLVKEKKTSTMKYWTINNGHFEVSSITLEDANMLLKKIAFKKSSCGKSGSFKTSSFSGASDFFIIF